MGSGEIRATTAGMLGNGDVSRDPAYEPSPAMVEGRLLALLTFTRREIITALHSGGPQTVQELALQLGITAGAVRQQMQLLIADGLVFHSAVVDGPGRPQHVYDLTALGSQLFPRNYQAVADLMLDEISDWDGALQAQFFRRMQLRRWRRSGRVIPGRSFAERARIAADTYNDEGYMAELELDPNGSATMTFKHCPLMELSARYPALCGIDVHGLTALLPEARVTLAENRADGGHRCVFNIAVIEQPQP